MKGNKGGFFHKFGFEKIAALGGHREHAHGNPMSGRAGHRHGRRLQPDEKLLSDCQAGDQVTIQRIVGGGPIRRRLLEMGMYSGTQVRVIKYAPLKDPLECEIKGYHIALRVAEAQRIIVVPEKP